VKVYLSGPMSGMPEFNFPLFNVEAAELRRLGYAVVNPVDINPDHSTPWSACLREDLRALLDCDAVAVLPGWEKSRGATLEVFVATQLGMRIADVGTLKDIPA